MHRGGPSGWVCDSWDDVSHKEAEMCHEAIYEGGAMIACAF